jgi:hypothetical protein
MQNGSGPPNARNTMQSPQDVETGSVQDALQASQNVMDCMNANVTTSNADILRLLRQQSELMVKYQQRLDETNARLIQSQKLLSQIASSVDVRLRHSLSTIC